MKTKQSWIATWAQNATQAGRVATALDLTREEAIERRANSGLGAGARLEAIFNNDDTANEDSVGEEITSMNDAIVCDILLGNDARASLRKFVHSQRRSTVWDGHNHVECPHEVSAELLDSLRRDGGVT